MMNNEYWDEFLIWLQNQIKMQLITPYLSQQHLNQLYKQYVLDKYGFEPPIPIQPMQQVPISIMCPALTEIPPFVVPVNVKPIKPELIISQESFNPQTENKIKKLLPRTPIGPIINMGNGQNILNITLNASTGNKTLINASADITIQSLLKMYTQKLGLPTNVIGKDIIFLYNGTQLDFNSQSTIGSLFNNTAVINVYDLGDIISA